MVPLRSSTGQRLLTMRIIVLLKLLGVSGLCLLYIYTISPSTTQFSQFSDCLQANETCHKDQKCKLLLSIIPRQCGEPEDDTGCTALQTEFCVQSLTDFLPYLSDCGCPLGVDNYVECLQFRNSVFGQRCAKIVQVEGKLVVKAKPLPQQVKPLPAKPLIPLTETDDYEEGPILDANDCLQLRKVCRSQRLCSRDLTVFTHQCKVRNNRCKANSREQCIQSYEALRPSGMFHCICDSQRKPESLEKCQGIHARFVQNACLVRANKAAITGKDAKKPTKPQPGIDGGEIPESENELPDIDDDEMDAEEEEDYEYNTWVEAEKTVAAPTTAASEDVSCYAAFASCNADSRCKDKVSTFLSACRWNLGKNACDRQNCLPAMDNFFQNVNMQHSHSAAFCTCEPHDEQCQSLKNVLQPKCAQVETPTPSCLNVFRKCMATDACRKRFEYYDTYCAMDEATGDCKNSRAMCRDAVVGLMGTLLMTNCSCEFEPAIDRCRAVMKNLHENTCKVFAVTNKRPTIKPVTTGQTPPKQQVLKDEKSVVKIHITSPMASFGKTHRACARRSLSMHRKLMRIYPNSTECSKLCRCLLDNTLSCQDMMCPSTDACRIDGITHTHGSMYVLNQRGQCQCRSGETICSKPGEQGGQPLGSNSYEPDVDGVYLYVGYSVDDMRTLANYSVKISYSDLSRKLTHLLNGQRNGETCIVAKHTQAQGNIVFRIETMRNPTYGGTGQTYNNFDEKQSEEVEQDPIQGCFFKAKLLEILINGRQEAISSDPELSIIRMASVETFIKKAESQTSGATMTRRNTDRTLTLLSLLLTMTFHWIWKGS